MRAVFSIPAFGQEASSEEGESSSEPAAAANANNPLADMQAFNLQNYYIPELSGLDNQNANTFWLRYAQPFYFVQLGKGLYVRGAPIAVFNLENNSYHVPVGLGLGKVIPTPSVGYNVFFEPQFTILDRGVGQPELQLFVGFNMQFLGG